MKTATVTWITYNNYGTMLQAYALQQYILSMKHENCIIDDHSIVAREELNTCDNTVVNEVASNQTSNSRIFHLIKKYLFHPLKLMKTAILKFKHKKYIKTVAPYYKSQMLYDSFRDTKLNIVSDINRENMKSLNDVYDFFICGSDQIWSVSDHNFDTYFYLDFVNKKKISYAPSIGTDNIPDDKIPIIKNKLDNFSAISVRESVTAKQLSLLLNKNVQWVCDPTMLHDKYFWSEFSYDISIKKDYLLCYFLSNKEWYFEYAKALAKQFKLKIILIPCNLKYTANKYCCKYPVGPQEFVGLIKNADFILTDSYHASIFSLIFEKRFLYLQRFNDNDPMCQNIRLTSLFEYLNIMDVIVPQKTFSPCDIINLNYKKINDLIFSFKEKSKKFLNGSLS